MRHLVWILILAVTLWSLDTKPYIEAANANYTQVVRVGIGTRTITAGNGAVFTETFGMFETRTYVSTITGTYGEEGPTMNTKTGTQTDTNCHSGGTQYGGGQTNLCNRESPTQQKNAQEDNKKNNDNGADQSTALGMAAIAAGMAMVAAGMALLPTPAMPAGVALIAAGMALIAAGMAALAAAGKMNNNADKSGYNAANLDNLNDKFKSTITPNPTVPGGGTSSLGEIPGANLGENGGSGIKIDPALARNGKMDGIFTDMEKKTGLNRDDMMKGLANGGNPLSMLASAPAFSGKPQASEANLQKMMDDTLAKGNLPSGQEVMDKLGLTKDDLSSNGGGADPNRGLASSANIDGLFPDKPAAPTPEGFKNDMKLSPEVQAALDKNGITGRSIFDMVHAQYVKKTPQMFGVDNNRKPTPGGILTGEKMEL